MKGKKANFSPCAGWLIQVSKHISRKGVLLNANRIAVYAWSFIGSIWFSDSRRGLSDPLRKISDLFSAFQIKGISFFRAAR